MCRPNSVISYQSNLEHQTGKMCKSCVKKWIKEYGEESIRKMVSKDQWKELGLGEGVQEVEKTV